MSGEVERADMRISTADRERTIEHLQNCAAEGRLDLDEFTERVDAVYAAKTFGELQPLLSDLPAVGDSTGVSAQAGDEEITATRSAVKRTGRWLVPRRLVLNSKGSAMRLDFSHAAIGHREVEVVLDIASSAVKLVLPRNAWAEEKIQADMSAVRNRAQHTGDEMGVRFRVHGTITASAVKIRRKRRFLWWEF